MKVSWTTKSDQTEVNSMILDQLIQTLAAIILRSKGRYWKIITKTTSGKYSQSPTYGRVLIFAKPFSFFSSHNLFFLAFLLSFFFTTISSALASQFFLAGKLIKFKVLVGAAEKFLLLTADPDFGSAASVVLSEVTFFHLAVVLVNDDDDDGAKVDLVRFNDKDDIAEDILKSLERLEAILALGLFKYFA